MVGPTLLGTLLDLTGRDFRLIFAYAAGALLLGALLLIPVRLGEAAPATGPGAGAPATGSGAGAG